MSWLVSNWRLKVLALVLAMALLGAVAFSDNPPVVTSVPVRVEYQPDPASKGLVLTEYPTTVSVQVIGLSSAVDQYRAGSAGVVVDLSHAKAGPHQTFSAQPKGAPPGITFGQRSIPVTISIEEAHTALLDIEVRTPNALPGIVVTSAYASCGNGASRCQVELTGPSSLFVGLKAYVLYDSQITSSFTSPGQTVRFERNGRPLDLGRLGYNPAPSWVPSQVTVTVAVKGGTATRTVTITYTLTGTQACGYSISSVVFSPAPTVNISGPTDEVARTDSVSIDPIGISGLSSTIQVSRTVHVSQPDLSATPDRVQVTISTHQAFSCPAPSPSGTP